MDLNLKDKVVIVTGAASGIGESTCRALAAEGAIPCMLDNDAYRLNLVGKEIEASGQNCLYKVVELTDASSCETAIDQILKKYDRIDGIVNNAGVNDGVGLENGNYDTFLNSLKRNVGHYFMLAHLALPSLKKARGAIVNISSKTALTGQGGTSGYAAANGERLALTQKWAEELSSFGIRVNAVVVAECWTPQYERWIGAQSNPQEKLKEITSKIPLENRMTTPQEIADTVLFLLSGKSPVNGQLVHVDGGYVHLDRSLTVLT